MPSTVPARSCPSCRGDSRCIIILSASNKRSLCGGPVELLASTGPLFAGRTGAVGRPPFPRAISVLYFPIWANAFARSGREEAPFLTGNHRFFFFYPNETETDNGTEKETGKDTENHTGKGKETHTGTGVWGRTVFGLSAVRNGGRTGASRPCFHALCS